MYTRKSLLGLWVFCEQSLSPGFGLFLTKCRKKTKSLLFRGKVKSRCFGLLTFLWKTIFFEKMLWGSGAIFFETFGFAPRKISRWKNLFVFSTTDVFVPVSQLSTRDLFDFLENLKIKQDIFVLGFSRVVWSLKQRALWFSYSRLSFGIGFLQSRLWCPSWIFDTSLSERCFFLNVLTCKKKS